MGKFLSASRYMALLAVAALLATALAAFAWGIAASVDAIILIVSTLGKDPETIVAIIKVVDAFLVATAVLIFALGIYELFVGSLNLPDWIQIHTLHDLKSKLGGVLILVMTVKFLEKLAEWKNAQETLYFALAIAVVAAVLIGFSAFGGKD